MLPLATAGIAKRFKYIEEPAVLQVTVPYLQRSLQADERFKRSLKRRIRWPARASQKIIS
jgi:hypothetical protein